MKGRKLSLLVGSVALVLSTIACVLNLGGPKYPPQSVPVSTQAATQAQDVISTADAQAAQTGKVDLVLTEAQATSYLEASLQQQSQPIITHPQVYFRDGTMQIYGTVNQGIITATAKIVVAIGVDSQGQPTIDVTSATFGPFPVPPSLRDMITNGIRDAYASALGSNVIRFQLESVTIGDGTMTMVGSLK